MKEILKLFKAVPISKKSTAKKISIEILKKTIKKGFVFSPEVLANYRTDEEVESLIRVVDSIYGLDAMQMNSSFHKSWGKVKNASDLQLIVEQVLHYFTTYGFEQLGIYDENSVYIPKEKLELPIINEDVKLMLITGLTYPEIKDKVLGLLDSGIALKEDTLQELNKVFEMIEIAGIEFTKKDIEVVKNKEAKILLMDRLGILPEHPIEFLRYLIFKITGNTLVIKNRTLINQIKTGENLETYFLAYKLEYGFENLAGIFHRYKPLFLAMKTNALMCRHINKIRKLADEHHKPMKEDLLNSITSKIKKGEKIDGINLLKELSRVNIFRKIRLLYALKFRAKDGDAIVYRIRNGKSYAKEFSFDKQEDAKVVMKIVETSIVSDLEKNVKGKKIFIPKFMKYSLPATQKQFTGNFPSGSYVETEKDLVVGIHWNNVEHHRIDLDLSMLDDLGKTGWDGVYRNSERSLMFSGDVTRPTEEHGASELFFQKKGSKGQLMLVNYYNYNKEVTVPFKILVAEETPKDFKQNYMVNPNNVRAVANCEMKNQQLVLGFTESMVTKNRFYFVHANVGGNITSSYSNDKTNLVRKYLGTFYKNMISLNIILKIAGAELVEKLEDADIDLSPENLEKDTIINILKENKVEK